MHKKGFNQPPSAIIFDRDGTLNALVLNTRGEIDSPACFDALELYPDLETILKPFHELKIPIFIATNQPGLAKGKHTLADLEEMHDFMKEHLGIVQIYSCLHHPIGNVDRGQVEYIKACDCRKPGSGMLFQIAQEHEIDLNRAIMFGDSQKDADAAKGARIGQFYWVDRFFSTSFPVEEKKYDFNGAPKLKDVVIQVVDQIQGVKK